MKQILYILIFCVGLSCCVHKGKTTDVYREKEDSIQISEEIDLDMMDLFCAIGVYAYNMDDLKEYGIADIRPYDRVDTFWNIIDSCEYHIYILDGRTYTDRENVDCCLNRLVYTKEEYEKIRRDSTYYVFCYRVRLWPGEEEHDTIVNHSLIAYY